MTNNDTNATTTATAVVPDATATAVVPAKRATTKPRAAKPAASFPLPRRIGTMAELITVGRHITALFGSVDSIVDATETIIRRYHVDVPNAGRNVSWIDGRRVMAVQNDIVRLSPPVSDIAFAAMHRIAFPAASGKFTTAPLSVAVGIASGVRAEWTRHGHGDPSWTRGMTAPKPADGPSVASIRTVETRRASMDAGVRRNA